MHFYSVHFVAMILLKLSFKVEAILNVSFLMRYSISYIKSRDQTFSSCNILFMSILEILFHEVQWKKHFTVYHRFYTMFKTTSIVRCAKYWLMFFKSNQFDSNHQYLNILLRFFWLRDLYYSELISIYIGN